MTDRTVIVSIGEASAEFRGLVERRRKHFGFLFSTAGGFAILVDGVLHGKLPKSLAGEGSTLLVAGATAVTLLSVVTALREARLHRGLVSNGRLLRQLSHKIGEGGTDRDFSPWTFNPFGVSTVLFTIALMSAAGLATFDAFVLGAGLVSALGTAAATAALLTLYFHRQHRSGGALAATRLTHVRVAERDVNAWRSHLTTSIDDAHRDMLELLSLAGLVAFAGFTLLAGIGEARLDHIGALDMGVIEGLAPFWLSFCMVGATALATVAYVRLRVAVGMFAKALDPDDQPFRALSLDDSFFGLLILLALFSFDAMLLATTLFPQATPGSRASTVCAFAIIIIASERLAMEWIGRQLSIARKARVKR